MPFGTGRLPSLEAGITHGTRQCVIIFDPSEYVLEVVGHPRFDSATVQLAQHATPKPSGELLLNPWLSPAIIEAGEDGCERHQLSAV